MRRLPEAILATVGVLGIPVLAVSVLRASGTITAMFPLIAVGVALSVAASFLGSSIWATRKDAGDMLFADLMLWGWLRRWYLERQLSDAMRLLGLEGQNPTLTPVQLSSIQQERLLRRLADGFEARRSDTHGHSRRVARHAEAIAKRMGLDAGEVTRIRTAATVHDVGKMYVPSAILNKPGKLTEKEFAAVKRHAEIGARMVAGLGDQQIARIVRHHHERLDGSGYPDGLRGPDIPLGARIIAVADTFDAITSTRPYRPAMRHKDALAVLAAESGTRLDAEAVRAFRRHYSGYRPVALWALLVNGPRQLLVSLATEAKLGGAVTAVALGAIATGEAVDHRHAGNSSPPPATRPSGAVASSPGGSAPTTAAGDGQGSGSNQQGTSRRTTSQDGASAGLGGGGPTDGPDSGGEASPPQAGGGTTPTQSGGGSSSSGGSSGGGSSGDTASNPGKPVSEIVSAVTAPVDSTVGAVSEKVDSAVKAVESATPVTVPEVQIPPALPKPPGK